MESSTNDVVKPFACPACASKFTRQENLSRHIASVHRKSNLRPFPCPQCAVSFSRSDLRKRHIRKFHPQQDADAGPAKCMTNSIGSDETGQLASTASQLNTAAHTPFIANAQSTVAKDKNAHDKNSNSTSDLFSANNISWLFKVPQFITAYFEKFHAFFPVIHQPTFDVARTKEPLLQAIACNGAIYHPVGKEQNISLGLFEAGLNFLDTYVQEAPCSRFRKLWVLQAYILFEHYAIYSCQDGLFTKALGIHRRIVDAARQYQLLQDGVTLNGGGPDSLHSATSEIVPEHLWQTFIEKESQKRIMYCLYYLDTQMSICCNARPLLTALELKYELPCQDDIWAAPTADAWQMLVQTQEVSFNEEDDNNANVDPRPAQGDLYENLMELMNPSPPRRPLGFLWRSPFSCLMLVTQIQMMVRDLTVASIFLYNNISSDENRHNLSIISEDNRAPIMRALEALTDLMPKINTPPWPQVFNNDDLSATPVDPTAWRPVWIAWHYTAICLTHQDALLSSGIVEYSLPNAISTTWELGKPRAKQHRDIYEDRDIVRLVHHFEEILSMLTQSPTSNSVGDSPMSPTASRQCTEDPFTTMLAFKASIMGWRVLRLMAVMLERSVAYESLQLTKPSIYSLSARIVLGTIMGTIYPDSENRILFAQSQSELQGIEAAKCEGQYLEWMEKTFSSRNVWPIGRWILAVISETRMEQ